MGIRVSLYEIGTILNSYNNFLIISLIPLEAAKNKFKSFEILRLGEVLSNELIQVDKGRREFEVENVTRQIFDRIGTSKIIVSDIDILFNPAYRLDIIKLFMQLARNKKMIVQWPGESNSEFLIYSELKYDDYKRYAINDYDIICLE